MVHEHHMMLVVVRSDDLPDRVDVLAGIHQGDMPVIDEFRCLQNLVLPHWRQVSEPFQLVDTDARVDRDHPLMHARHAHLHVDVRTRVIPAQIFQEIQGKRRFSLSGAGSDHQEIRFLQVGHIPDVRVSHQFERSLFRGQRALQIIEVQDIGVIRCRKIQFLPELIQRDLTVLPLLAFLVTCPPDVVLVN